MVLGARHWRWAKARDYVRGGCDGSNIVLSLRMPFDCVLGNCYETWSRCSRWSSWGTGRWWKTCNDRYKLSFRCHVLSLRISYITQVAAAVVCFVNGRCQFHFFNHEQIFIYQIKEKRKFVSSLPVSNPKPLLPYIPPLPLHYQVKLIRQISAKI